MVIYNVIDKTSECIGDVQTKEDGKFLIKIQKNSDYVLEGIYQAEISIGIWIEGYKPFEKMVAQNSLREGETIDLGIINIEPGYKVTGYVYDEKDNPIQGATIQIYKENEGLVKQSIKLITDKNGYFRNIKIPASYALLKSRRGE